MDNNLDILLRFLLDQQSTAQVSAGTNSIASDLDNVDKIAKEIDKTFVHLGKEIKNATSVKELESLERQLHDVEDQVNETTRAYSLQAKVLRAEAAAITDDFAQARLSQINAINQQVGDFSRTALGLGVGVVGGIFAAAAKYVKDAKEATAVTRAWKAEQESLTRSGERFGAVLAQEALPMLRKAADLADRATQFVEDHPGVIRAALNTGVALATLGAVGVAVSKGIKLYSDIQTIALGAQQLTAAKLQDTAADKQLAAATLRAKASGVDLPNAGGDIAKGAGGAGLIAGLNSPGGVVALIIGTLAASNFLADKLLELDKMIVQVGEKYKVNTGILKTVITDLDIVIGTTLPLVLAIKNAKTLLEQRSWNNDGPTPATGGSKIISGFSSGGGLASSTFESALKAYEDYRNDDLEMVRDHYEERERVIQDALKAEQDENKQYAASVAKVRQSTASSLAKAAESFTAANVRAEQQYQEQRAQIIRDGNDEIAKIQENSKERLRKLEQDHNDRVESLTAARDALGLARENRQYRQDVQSERREATQEVRERRIALQQRLADLQASYERERAERLTDYQARVAEIKAQAAERMKELAIEHQEELARIREQKANKLREMDTQYVEERKRRYQYFIQQIRDIDAALLGERALRIKYQTAMSADLNAFLASYRARMATLASAVPGRADGGYAAGLINTGERGIEYVLTNRTVQAAENMIGGKLTQDAILSRMMRGSSQSVTWNDQRRFSGEYTGPMRRAVQRDTEKTIERMFS